VSSYAVQADLEQRFGIDAVLTASDRNGKGEINVPIVNLALVDATAEIDSYLTERYDLPLTTVPTILARVCCDIAMYRMSADAGTLTEEKRTRFEDAIKWLTAVSKSVAGLGLASDDSVALDLPQTSVEMASGQRLFTRAKLGGLL